MTTTEILGVMGFCVACLGFVVTSAHIVWQVWWHHHQNHERVRALVLMDPQPHVRIHNIGVVPVFLTAVELVWGDQRFPLVTVIPHHCLPRAPGEIGETVWQTTGATTYSYPLERGNAFNFILTTKGLPAVAGRRYISVRSYGGELCRVMGKHVNAFLAAVAAPRCP